MHSRICVVALLVAVMAAGIGLRAQETDSADALPAVLAAKVAELDAVCRDAGDRPRVLEAISRDTGVAVEILKAQRAQSGLECGGLYVATIIARQCGKTFEQIAAENKLGKSWGQIAKESGIDWNQVIIADSHIDKELRKRR